MFGELTHQEKDTHHSRGFVRTLLRSLRNGSDALRRIDTGFTYQHTEGGDDSFAMTSGNYAGPRFGFKGTEDLGDNLTLGFVLEAGFNSDTGAQGEDGNDPQP